MGAILGQLSDKIKHLVMTDRYIVGAHAVERLDERHVLEWQIVHGIDAATILRERLHDRPNPSIELEQVLADGTSVKVIWSHVTALDVAKLVTVHFFDE